jgi:hypothetical protein
MAQGMHTDVYRRACGAGALGQAGMVYALRQSGMRLPCTSYLVEHVEQARADHGVEGVREHLPTRDGLWRSYGGGRYVEGVGQHLPTEGSKVLVHT